MNRAIRQFYLFILILPGLAAGGCASREASAPEQAAHTTAAVEAGAHAAPHWSYGGDTGPEKWAKLGPECAACGTGREQSPVDLTGAVLSDIPNPEFQYAPAPATLVNNGHTIQVNVEPGSGMTLGGERYELVQFHFHAPSEHTVEGRHSPMEAHLVHKNAAGELAVVGVMIEEGNAHPVLAALWKGLPSEAGAEATTAGPVDVGGLLPAVRTTYRYHGSLTTPPCTEGVKWTVMTQPIEASAEQIAAFTKLFPNNSRPVQPIYERAVILDTTP